MGLSAGHQVNLILKAVDGKAPTGLALSSFAFLFPEDDQDPNMQLNKLVNLFNPSIQCTAALPAVVRDTDC